MTKFTPTSPQGMTSLHPPLSHELPSLTRFVPQTAVPWYSLTTNLCRTRNTNMLLTRTAVVVGGGVGVGVVEQDRATADPLVQAPRLRGAASCDQA